MPAALSQKDLASLLSLLADEERTLEAVAGLFQRSFAKTEHFRAATCLCLLIQDRAVDLPQRIFALYILFDLYKGEAPGTNPFLPVLIEEVKRDLAPAERRLLLNLLSYPPKDLAKKSPAELLAEEAAGLGGPLPEPDIEALQSDYLLRMGVTSGFLHTGLSPVLMDPDSAAGADYRLAAASDRAGGGDAGESSLEDELRAEVGDDEWAMIGFEPALFRPAPFLLPPGDGEMAWLGHDSDFSVMWDPGMGDDPTRLEGLRDLMRRACKMPLQAAQQQQVLADLEDSRLIFRCGLTPDRLPDLVEHNPQLAIETLLRLMASSRITEYLQTLVNMPMSLHSMEVVNRLTTAVDLPSEFVHLYISNCISSCAAIKDKYMQNRLVRLVCVFLQSLIRNKIINVQVHKDLLIEVQAFCIEFSRIREAAGLFRLLKTLE